MVLHHLLNTGAQVRRMITSVIFLTLVTACAGTAPPPSAEAMEAYTFADEYRIGVGDTLSISVWRNEDLSVTVPVRPDGKISVPLAGDVNVGGKTPDEISVELTKTLGTYIRDPFVTVIVTDMGSDEYRSRVRITGAVAQPTSIAFRQGMTVLDIVLEAGGVTEFANPAKAVLYRRSGERLPVRLDRILDRGDMGTNYPMHPGDVLTIPERIF